MFCVMRGTSRDRRSRRSMPRHPWCDTATGFNATERLYKDNTYGGVARLDKADYIRRRHGPDAASRDEASQAAYLSTSGVNSITLRTWISPRCSRHLGHPRWRGVDAAGSFTSTSGYDSARSQDASSIQARTRLPIWIEPSAGSTPRQPQPRSGLATAALSPSRWSSIGAMMVSVAGSGRLRPPRRLAIA